MDNKIIETSTLRELKKEKILLKERYSSLSKKKDVLDKAVGKKQQVKSEDSKKSRMLSFSGKPLLSRTAEFDSRILLSEQPESSNQFFDLSSFDNNAINKPPVLNQAFPSLKPVEPTTTPKQLVVEPTEIKETNTNYGPREFPKTIGAFDFGPKNEAPKPDLTNLINKIPVAPTKKQDTVAPPVFNTRATINPLDRFGEAPPPFIVQNLKKEPLSSPDSDALDDISKMSIPLSSFAKAAEKKDVLKTGTITFNDSTKDYLSDKKLPRTRNEIYASSNVLNAPIKAVSVLIDNNSEITFNDSKKNYMEVIKVISKLDDKLNEDIETVVDGNEDLQEEKSADTRAVISKKTKVILVSWFCITILWITFVILWGLSSNWTFSIDHFVENFNNFITGKLPKI